MLTAVDVKGHDLLKRSSVGAEGPAMLRSWRGRSALGLQDDDVGGVKLAVEEVARRGRGRQGGGAVKCRGCGRRRGWIERAAEDDAHGANGVEARMRCVA